MGESSAITPTTSVRRPIGAASAEPTSKVSAHQPAIRGDSGSLGDHGVARLECRFDQRQRRGGAAEQLPVVRVAGAFGRPRHPRHGTAVLEQEDRCIAGPELPGEPLADRRQHAVERVLLGGRLDQLEDPLRLRVIAARCCGAPGRAQRWPRPGALSTPGRGLPRRRPARSRACRRLGCPQRLQVDRRDAEVGRHPGRQAHVTLGVLDVDRLLVEQDAAGGWKVVERYP